MPIFEYQARNQKGDIETGEIEAPEYRIAVERLKSKQLRVIEIEEKVTSSIALFFEKINPFKPKVKENELVIFSRQLSTLVSAGVPIVQGLSILAEQIEGPFFKGIIDKVREDIENGMGIAEALTKHPNAFDNLFINMIKAGEIGGILDEILERMADYLEESAKLKSKVKGALIYPAVISFVAIGVTVFLIIFIIPTFAGIFMDFGQDLPLPTQMLISLSDWMRSYILYFIGVVVLAVFGVRKYYATDGGSKKIDDLLLKLPVFGVLLQKVAIGKFSRTFGTLVQSGVPILEALDTVAYTSGNRVIETAVLDSREAIREGEKIADPLIKSGVFPPMVLQMIAIGEETGNLDIMLTKIADFYDSEVDASVEGLTSLIEPLIMVFLGVVVGAIVLAMYLPIFNMSSMVG
ncbi:MAG: type II secretion system F family protein [Elusimicrobia bacterium]|nr:type II secretion system F family protein [Elusimicrobiota bacterium]